MDLLLSELDHVNIGIAVNQETRSSKEFSGDWYTGHKVVMRQTSEKEMRQTCGEAGYAKLVKDGKSIVLIPVVLAGSVSKTIMTIIRANNGL